MRTPHLEAFYTIGAYDDEVPPVPIPNTEVKLVRVESTWRETAWEDRSVPVSNEKGLCFCTALFSFVLIKIEKNP